MLLLRSEMAAKEKALYPLRRKDFRMHLFCKHVTKYDNPNCIFQVGDGFGFIISIANIL